MMYLDCGFPEKMSAGLLLLSLLCDSGRTSLMSV